MYPEKEKFVKFRSMTPYPAYKASGIEWLGEIPEHWEVKKLKYCDEVIMGQSPNSEDYQLEPDGLPFLQGNADFTQFYPKPRIWCNTANKIAETDDILLSVRAPIGAVNIADQRYGIGRGLCAIRSIKTDKKYLYYIVLCLSDELNSIGTGSTFTAVSVDEIRNLPISQPRSLEEQRAIAAYLDHKTRLIDTYITKKQQQVERWQAYRAALINQAVTKGLNPDAPMKASDIEWLGDIPAHWETTALKYILNVRSGEGISPNEIESDEGTYEVYGGNGLLGYTEKFNVSEQTLIIGRVGAKCGNVHLVKGEKWVSDNALAVKTGENYKFLYFLLTTMNLNNLANQNAQPLITGTMIKSQRIGIPDLDEQQVIVAYLDEQTAKIDTLAAATQRQLDRLHAYRATLISDVVTGKIDVRSRKDLPENHWGADATILQPLRGKEPLRNISS